MFEVKPQGEEVARRCVFNEVNIDSVKGISGTKSTELFEECLKAENIICGELDMQEEKMGLNLDL